MKKILAIVAVVGVLVMSAFAIPPIGGAGAVNSTYSSTNIVLNGLWPNSIAASTTVTNITAFDVSGGRYTSLEFTASAVQTNGGIVIAQLGRSVSGGALTNTSSATAIARSGASIEWFGTITNTLPANTATTPNTVIYSFEPASGQNTTGKGAVSTFYVGTITTPANVTLTNYSIVPITR